MSSGEHFSTFEWSRVARLNGHEKRKKQRPGSGTALERYAGKVSWQRLGLNLVLFEELFVPECRGAVNGL